jgi:hypothetical protein
LLQLSSSSQGVPLAIGMSRLQLPELPAGLQEARAHWVEKAEQLTGVPTHVVATQASFSVHGLPSSHGSVQGSQTMS